MKATFGRTVIQLPNNIAYPGSPYPRLSAWYLYLSWWTVEHVWSVTWTEWEDEL